MKEKLPENFESKDEGIEYAHGHMEKLMKETLADGLRGWKLNREAISDVIGYPRKGRDKDEFYIDLLVIVDRNIDNLGQTKPFIAIKMDKIFKLTKDRQPQGGFLNASIMTHERQPTEADLQNYFKSKGKNLYRIKI